MFSINQKVRCVSDDFAAGLTKGKVYEIHTDEGGRYVHVRGPDGRISGGWERQRFEAVGEAVEEAPAPKTFKVGDIVALQSGGPDMTVSSIEGALVITQWFSTAHILESGGFPPACLALVP